MLVAALTSIAVVPVKTFNAGEINHNVYDHDIQKNQDIEVTRQKWSRLNVSILADFPLGLEEIGYEEEAFFDRTNCGCPEAG